MSLHKGFRSIIIALGVIVVCGLGIFLMIRFVPEREDPNVSPSPTDAPPAVYMVQEDPELMTRMEVVFADGASISVDYSVDADERFVYTVEPPATYFAYNTSKFRSMRYTTSSMTVKAIVEKDAKDKAKYGLDTPEAEMTLSYSNGKKVKIFVGDPTPVDMNYFACSDQSDDVYIIGNYLASLLLRQEREYRMIATFPTYTEDEIYEKIDWVRLTKRDGTVIEIQGNAETSLEDNIAMSYYMLLSPVESSANDEVVRSQIMDVVAQIRYVNIDTDIRQDKLKDYGLDKPARLQMRDTDGNMIDIMVGKQNGGTGGYFYCADADQYTACVEDNEELTLLLYSPEAFAWMDINYVTLINRAIWLQNIHSVAAIDYEYHGESYHLELSEYDDVTNSGVDVVRTVGILNGSDVNEDDTKRLYGRTLNLRAVGDVAPGTELGEAEYVITFTLRNGGMRRLELVPMNNRQYAAVVDGVAEHYIYAANIQNFIQAIERIKDNRPVPLVYYT
ncbi:MAG: DUF4340 domain-containing protein [Oscillospiraceae bacterium]|jgi:hypothetical protein|nr:DUF4340 domain-containing protein [Oscillospiraceae bacterium]